MRHQAHRVAVVQYTAALELLGRLPDTAERAGHEAGAPGGAGGRAHGP